VRYTGSKTISFTSSFEIKYSKFTGQVNEADFGRTNCQNIAGLEIMADQRSMIDRKLFLIGEEATLPFILIGRKYI
jgi:hypothetical protein